MPTRWSEGFQEDEVPVTFTPTGEGKSQQLYNLVESFGGRLTDKERGRFKGLLAELLAELPRRPSGARRRTWPMWRRFQARMLTWHEMAHNGSSAGEVVEIYYGTWSAKARSYFLSKKAHLLVAVGHHQVGEGSRQAQEELATGG